MVVNRNSVLLVASITALIFVAGTLSAAELPVPPPPPAWHHGVSPQLQLSPEAGQSIVVVSPDDELEWITERYPNRAVKIRRAVKQDEDRNYINHGPWTMYDPQGQIVAQGEYLDGKRHGAWMKMLPHFPAVEPDFSGPYHSQAEFQADRLHGTWTIIDQQQRVVGSWQFEEGQLHGEVTVWYPNGQQRQMMSFKSGEPDGEAIAWKPDGNVWGRDYYRDGKQLVPVVNWHDRQQKKSEGWLLRSNFVMHAKADWWNGIVEVAREETTGVDVRIGQWTEWYANGGLRYRGSFHDGGPMGEHILWHENGQKQLAGLYLEGDRDGRWTQWFASGQKQQEGEYLAGVKDGRWTVWDTTGQVVEVLEMDLNAGNPQLTLDEFDSFAPVSIEEQPR
jgi:antitoxin component YwqK of YwqJK toxin-antitoxin module